MSNHHENNKKLDIYSLAALLTAIAALLTAFGVPDFLPEVAKNVFSRNSLEQPVSASSDRGIDYTVLEDLLENRKWEEANSTTIALMLKAADREKEGYIGTTGMKQFPCKDLMTIERLWSTYSDRRFGFETQYSIWKDLGGQRYRMGSDPTLFDRFTAKVGWDKDIEFSIEAVPGHLPVFSSGAKLGGIGNTYRIVECMQLPK